VVQPYVSEITCNKVDKLSLDHLVGLCAKASLTVLSGWSLSRIPYYKVRPLSLQCQRFWRYARNSRWRDRRTSHTPSDLMSSLHSHWCHTATREVMRECRRNCLAGKSYAGWINAVS
jgi:hypothetical protein